MNRENTRSFITTLFLFSLFWMNACSSRISKDFFNHVTPPAKGRQFLDLLDKTVDQAQVRHARFASIEGFPYLRTDRFLVEAKNHLKTTLEMKKWILNLQQLDLEARKIEVQNLPQQAVEKLLRQIDISGDTGKEKLMEQIKVYSNQLLTVEQGLTGFYQTVKESAQFPDDYSTAMRVFGVYPVAALPVIYFSDGFFDQIRQWYQTPLEDLPIVGELTAYTPKSEKTLSETDIQHLFNTAPPDELNRPILTPVELQNLADYFAPVFIQDVAAEWDKIGEVIWQNGQLGIDSSQPVVYTFFSHTYIKQLPVLQINYVFWNIGRLGEYTPWFERGHMDGFTLRVTLDQSGIPAMVDSMNNCGCSHVFIPNRNRIRQVKTVDMGLDPVVPTDLPDGFPTRRLAVRINSGWHQAQHIDLFEEGVKQISYNLVPYRRLESLPKADGSFESMFDSRGIGKGTERVEPYFFFSMGIPEVGAMRQRGHHPTAMTGRVHFDDPLLLNRFFEW